MKVGYHSGDIRDYLILAIPEFPGYYADGRGNIWSKQGKKMRVRKWHFKDARRRRKKIELWRDGRGYHRYVSRLVLSAKIQRPLCAFEDACHVDGNPLNNTMSNLQAGDRLNNIIDDLELGRLSTSRYYIDRAIVRLEELRGSKRLKTESRV